MKCYEASVPSYQTTMQKDLKRCVGGPKCHICCIETPSVMQHSYALQKTVNVIVVDHVPSLVAQIALCMHVNAILPLYTAYLRALENELCYFTMCFNCLFKEILCVFHALITCNDIIPRILLK